MLDRDADNLAARVYATLGSEILTGRMAAGAKLVEESLSERLGVSRGPVREAIRRLATMPEFRELTGDLAGPDHYR